jgi:hypothetical protein
VTLVAVDGKEIGPATGASGGWGKLHHVFMGSPRCLTLGCFALSATILVYGCTGNSSSRGEQPRTGGTTSLASVVAAGGATAGAVSLGGSGGGATQSAGGASPVAGAAAKTGGALASGDASTSGGAGAGGAWSMSFCGTSTTGGTTATGLATGGTTQVLVTSAGVTTSGGTRTSVGGSGGATHMQSSASTPMTGGTTAWAGSSGKTGGVTQTSSTAGGTHSPGGSSAGASGTSAPACPTSTDFVGSKSWLGKVQATETAEYCGTSRETRTLEQELAAKAKMRIPAGTYPLPEQAGTYSFAWPVCFEFPPGKEAPKFAGAGQILLKRAAYTADEFYRYAGTQPVTSSQSTDLLFLSDLSDRMTPGAGPPTFVLDGRGPTLSDSWQSVFSLCQSEDCAGKWDEVQFYSCGSDRDRLLRDTITFFGGQLVLELRIGIANAGTEPSSFVLASGTLDGTTFAQRDYWKLVYRPEHHHYYRHFAVLFDAPIAGACGLKAEKVGDAAVSVHTINCDLSNLASISVTTATTERL